MATKKSNITKKQNIQINNVGGPDGQGQKIRRLNAQSLPDPGPDDHQSLELEWNNANHTSTEPEIEYQTATWVTTTPCIGGLCKKKKKMRQAHT